MKRLINSIINIKTVLIFFIISSVLYFLMILVTIPLLHRFSGGIKIPDMMPIGYSYDYIVQLMNALGEKGRHFYLTRQLPIDFIFPFFFGISNCLLIAWFLKKLSLFESKWYLACYLPLIAGIFDYAENLSVVFLLKGYPLISHEIVKIANFCSVLKSTTTTVTLVFLIITVLIWGFRLLKSNLEKRN